MLKTALIALPLAALATLIVLDPFSGPQTAEQRIKDARLSGGKDAELWLVTFDVAGAIEAYVQEQGGLPQELEALRPRLPQHSQEFLNSPGNSVAWSENNPVYLEDADGRINLDVEVTSGTDRVWESYLIKRQKR